MGLLYSCLFLKPTPGLGTSAHCLGASILCHCVLPFSVILGPMPLCFWSLLCQLKAIQEVLPWVQGLVSPLCEFF